MLFCIWAKPEALATKAIRPMRIALVELMISYSFDGRCGGRWDRLPELQFAVGMDTGDRGKGYGRFTSLGARPFRAVIRKSPCGYKS